MFLTLQQRAEGTPFELNVASGTVRDGTIGSGFSNDGSTLRMTDIEAVELLGIALVSTGNNGATFLQDVRVSSSEIGVSNVRICLCW